MTCFGWLIFTATQWLLQVPLQQFWSVGEVLTYEGIQGMCYSNGLLFHNKFPNMGPIFCKTFPKHRSVFICETKFLCVRMASAPTLKWTYFLRKILKMDTFSCQNDPLKWVGISQLQQHPLSKPYLSTTLGYGGTLLYSRSSWIPPMLQHSNSNLE